MKKVFFSMAVLGLVFASSCKKDDDSNDEKSCTELLADFTAATQAFANTPEDASVCADYKLAAQAYVDAECVTGDQAVAIEAVADLDCSML